MANLPIKRSTAAVRSAADVVVPGLDAISGNEIIELSVRIDDHDLVARDMAAFFEFFDHVYGRTVSQDFRSYALREKGHVAFTTTKKGSWELLLQQALSVASNAEPIVILWLVIKYLPAAMHTSASSFNEIQQGLLARENRKRIREEMEQDNALARLPKERRAELASLIHDITEKEKDLLPRLRRFMRKSFLQISIRVKNKGKK